MQDRVNVMSQMNMLNTGGSRDHSDFGIGNDETATK